MEGKKQTTYEVINVEDDTYEGDDPSDLDIEAQNQHRALWQDSWLASFKWLVLDNEKASLFCSYCLDYPHARSAFSKRGSKNFKTSNLRSHSRTNAMS
eukprot:c32967_g1_i1 orf=119-412(-)